MKFTLADRLLMVPDAVVLVLLAFWSLQSSRNRQCLSPRLRPALTQWRWRPHRIPPPHRKTTPASDKPGYDPAVPLAEDLQLILREACEEHSVDLAPALGVIEVESRFVATADNGSDYGLM